MSDKEAKFFCEYCDSEVPRNARFCKKCGHFFLSVRCPACGKTGDQSEFTDGCPACGYAFSGTPQKAKPVEPPAPKKKIAFSAFFPKKQPVRYYHGAVASAPVMAKKEDSLPLWIYLFTAGILVGLILFFLSLAR